MEAIKILQIGDENLEPSLHLPPYVEYTYVDEIELDEKIDYDVVFLFKYINEVEKRYLQMHVKAYNLFILDTLELDASLQWVLDSRKGKRISKEGIQAFIDNDSKFYFKKPYGEKFKPYTVSISRDFKGSVTWNGFSHISLEGEYGDDFYQIAYWKMNIPVFDYQSIDFWLEYEKEETVELQFHITKFKGGSISTIEKEWIFNEEDMQDVMRIDNDTVIGSVYVSLFAKGRGKLKIVGLHDRYSRRDLGYFLVGGERIVTSKREEIFFYFDPGDLQPPLNVYFSGYKTQEGFEGYNMLRKLGCPFLLISESRLEGGAFYIGSEEYENSMVDKIQSYMDSLGFTREQVNFSGLSMGTFGALYYGCDIKPHAIILGKPLASLGDMASYERLDRPGGFPTSLDVVWKNYHDLEEQSLQSLNQKFWNTFDASDFSKTKFIISYMIEDDYDKHAYRRLLSHLHSDGVSIIGKGIHGRHNDNSYEIVRWFVNQYEKMLRQDFNRRKIGV